MSDKNLNFCERLKKLMDKNGYKNAAELSRAFFQTGIKEYKKSKGLTHIEQEHNLKDQINTHLRQPEFGKVSLKNISLYCRLLGCSSDYLLGVIDYPTYEIKSVSEQTGLSQDAIEKLQKWNDDGLSALLGCLSNLIVHEDFKKSLNNMMKLQELYLAKNGDYEKFRDIHQRNQLSMDLQGKPYTTDAIIRDADREIKTEKYNLNLTLTNMIDEIAKKEL